MASSVIDSVILILLMTGFAFGAVILILLMTGFAFGAVILNLFDKVK